VGRLTFNSGNQVLRLENRSLGLEIDVNGVATVPSLRSNTTVRLSNFENDGCPTAMERVGTSCIDMDVSGHVAISTAMMNCHNKGKHMCAVDVLMLCDQVEPRGASGPVPGSCDDRTDRESPTTYRIATGTVGGFQTSDVYGESAFNNWVCYDPTPAQAAKSFDGCTSSSVEEYFCCTPANPLAIGRY